MLGELFAIWFIKQQVQKFFCYKYKTKLDIFHKLFDDYICDNQITISTWNMT